MKTITFTITDMHCPACVMRLEGLEDDLPGVSSAKGSYKKQTLEVTYDERVLDPQKIAAAVEELGYTTTI